MGDGTADTDGWLTMTVHDGGFKHTAQKAEHISKGSVLALTLVAGRSNGCFFMVQQPCPGSLSPGLLANACTITYLTRWKERSTIRFIPELVHNLASALALRAPLASQRQVETSKSRLHVYSSILYSYRLWIGYLEDPVQSPDRFTPPRLPVTPKKQQLFTWSKNKSNALIFL